MNSITVLRESLFMLSRQPKLFLPKIIVAALYGLALLAFAEVFTETVSLLSFPSAKVFYASRMYFFFKALALLAYSTAVLVIDVLVNAMYPVMVKGLVESGKVSFKEAFRVALRRLSVVFPAVIAVEFAVAVPFAFLSSMLLLSGNFFALLALASLFLATSFAFTAAFYVVYPFAVFKGKNFFLALLGSLKLGVKNLKVVFFPALVPFSLSLVNFALAFFAANPLFFTAFVASRFLVALFYTYHMVVNPNIYFALADAHEPHN